MLILYFFILVQICAESFPISSSGHCTLMACIMNYFFSYDVSPFLSDSIMYFVHIPTVFVIALFFFSDWWPALVHYRKTWRSLIPLVLWVAIADSITAIFLYIIRSYSISIPLSLGFAITACLLLSLRWCPVNSSRRITWQAMLLLGIAQGMALLPGISRLATVFTVSRWLGFDGRTAFALSWAVVWPLLVAASAKSIIMLLLNPALGTWITPTAMLIMMIASVVALGGMSIVYALVRANKLWWISMYMLIPLVLAYLFC